MRQTDLPFREAVAELLEERDLSERAFARRMREKTGWGSAATLWQIYEKRIHLTETALVNVARTFNVSPAYFPEYRLMMARRELDPDEVGLEQALKTLASLPRLSR